MFRDLEKNFVLVRPDQETGELDFEVVEAGFQSDPELQSNQVDAVQVTESQEDVYDMKALFRIGTEDGAGNSIDLAMLAETDEDKFRSIVTRLFDLINHKCSMLTPAV